MRDIASIARGTFKDRDGKVISVVRVHRLSANKYSKRYMELSARIAPSSSEVAA